MSDVDALKAWRESVERTVLAGKALVAALKLFETGGKDADSAWETVEKARWTYVALNAREAKLWRKLGDDPDQTEIPGTERAGPCGPRPWAPSDTKQLPPASAT
jgi:hypothetical protein